MTSAGCSTFAKPSPVAVQGVTAPRECQRLGRPVSDPGVREGDDLGDVAAGYRAAWLKAERRNSAMVACQHVQADEQAKGARR